MGVGMLGVFILVGVIIGSTYLIGYATKRIEENRLIKKVKINNQKSFKIFLETFLFLAKSR